MARGCQDFYGKEYLGHHVTAKNANGEKIKVKFTGKALNKLHDIITETPECAKVLPFLPDIIQTGKCLGDPLPTTKERKNYNDFLYYYKKIEIDGKPTDVIVDIGRITTKGAPIHEQYNYSTPERKDWGNKKKALERAYGKFTSDASTAPYRVTTSHMPKQNKALDVFTSDSVDNTQEYELVNIRVMQPSKTTVDDIKTYSSKTAFIKALARYFRSKKGAA